MTQKYNLQDRTKLFAIDVIKLCRSIKQDNISRPMVGQLVRAATSIGANYCEAVGASSKKDFKNKIFICKKEAQETRYWLEILKESNILSENDVKPTLAEVDELIRILHTIAKNTVTENCKINN